jgi:hypothetical protein
MKRRREQRQEVPAAANLDTWTSHPWTDGVQIDRTPDLEAFLVHTYGDNTLEITVVCGSKGEILVRGGRLFPERTAAQLSGASLGGSFLKLRSIHVGFCIEFHVDNMRIVTSPVRSIQRLENGYTEAA